MSEPSKTGGFTTLWHDTRDPLSLLNAHLHELLLETLCAILERSLEHLPSMYLAKSQFVQEGKSDNKLSMRFDLHIKADGAARDAAIITLTFLVEPKETESC